MIDVLSSRSLRDELAQPEYLAHDRYASRIPFRYSQNLSRERVHSFMDHFVSLDVERSGELRKSAKLLQTFSADRIVRIHPTDLAPDLIHAFIEHLESVRG